ncbi:MAG TPA: alanine--tRNA ligase-related protein, partial [Candidatus Saccharimonadales bacterium]|nr:alanine--tRNA ligase-related protein [Candidatus Saccharimonadales bacterium]
CDCGRFFEISNSVFMQYKKTKEGTFEKLPNQNVDHGAGLERFLAAIENKPDVFETNLFYPIIQTIEKLTGKSYKENARSMRIVTDHFISAVFITLNNVDPSNTDQGYILRRLIRRGLDNFSELGGKDVAPVLETIVDQYRETDPDLVKNFEKIKNTIIEEGERYAHTLKQAKSFIAKKYKSGDELMGTAEISADDAFVLYTTHGLSPTQIKSLGYTFNEQGFAQKMETHQNLSREGAKQKFAGGLADHSEKTIMGHTATHLMHQALRDVLGNHVHQTGSNITASRIRFDFNYDQKLTGEQIKKVEDIVNEKIKQNLPVHFEMMPVEKAKKLGAIGLFDQKYEKNVKIYFIGEYSKEFCGGPHVEFTAELKRFTIIKQENLGAKQKRLYAVVG